MSLVLSRPDGGDPREWLEAGVKRREREERWRKLVEAEAAAKERQAKTSKLSAASKALLESAEFKALKERAAALNNRAAEEFSMGETPKTVMVEMKPKGETEWVTLGPVTLNATGNFFTSSTSNRRRFVPPPLS